MAQAGAIRAATVPCNGCTACCRGESVPLMVMDNPAAFRTQVIDGRLYLERGPDGSCVYLGAHGCTIHHRKPAFCRNFDCRRYWTQATEEQRQERAQRSPRWRAIIEAGRQRVKGG